MVRASFLPAVVSGSAAAVAAGLGYLLREARGLLGHLPLKVGRLLADREIRARLTEIVLTLSGYANLSKAQRREKALEFVGRWLTSHGIRLADHELALLVELLYTGVKRQFPERIAPEPVGLVS